MRFLITLLLLGIGILLTLITMFSGGQIYLIYVPGATGDGIAEYSPLWLFIPELIIAGLTLKKNLWGLVVLLGIASCLSIDVISLFFMMDVPDGSLKMQAAIISVFWLTVISGAASYRFFKD